MTIENAERERRDVPGWRRWGPYLSERAWGTVREDYSADGDAWSSFPHDHARSRAYRWSEDGLGGICDENQILCLAFAFWNGRDAILKERAFGLTGHEGNHGEDAKEYWWYLDATPTHSWMRWRYAYPLPLAGEQPQLLLGERRVHVRERHAVEGQIPGGVQGHPAGSVRLLEDQTLRERRRAIERTDALSIPRKPPPKM